MVRYILFRQVKGQTFMPDYLASLLVFGLIVTIFFSFWNSILANQTAFTQEREMRSEAVRTTTFLVSTRGYPPDWDAGSVQIPGFASDDHVLNSTKLDEFGSLGTDQQSSLLRVQNFHINISNSSGTLEVDGSDTAYGNPPSDPDTVVPVRRNVLVNDSGNLHEAELEYLVWR